MAKIEIQNLEHGKKRLMIDGREVSQVLNMTVKYAAQEPAIAEIELLADHEQIEAEPMLAIESVKRAAAYYGYELHPVATP